MKNISKGSTNHEMNMKAKGSHSDAMGSAEETQMHIEIWRYTILDRYNINREGHHE